MKLVRGIASVAATVAVALSVVASQAMAAAAEEWPDRIVSVDKMTFITPLKVSVPTPRAVDRSKTSSLVLHIVVDEKGLPLRQRIEQSSGNPNLDEAALHAVRTARFEPYVEDGTAVPVTVVAPMHFPFQERRR